MFKISSLKGQIAIGILFSLLFPVIVDWDSNGTSVLNVLNLFIQLVGLCVLFGIIKNGKGSEFKVTRMNIAIYLWVNYWLRLHGSRLLEQFYGVDRFLPKAVLFASYNAMVIAMVVLFSYVIGKWINEKIVKEETLFNRSTLKGQIAICISLSLPIPTIMDGLYVVTYALILLMPFVIFCVLFWLKNSKGAEFKVMRIMIATISWATFCIASFFNGGYSRLLERTGLEPLRFQMSRGQDDWYTTSRHIHEVLFASYSAIGIAMVVILSYVICKWINSKICNQITEKRA